MELFEPMATCGRVIACVVTECTREREREGERGRERRREKIGVKSAFLFCYDFAINFLLRVVMKQQHLGNKLVFLITVSMGE